MIVSDFVDSNLTTSGPLTRADLDRAFKLIEEAPTPEPYYRTRPHAPHCYAVRAGAQWFVDFGEPCPEPSGWWMFCDCGAMYGLADHGYLTIRGEVALARLLYYAP